MPNTDPSGNPPCVLYHLPKTGGTTLRFALDAIGRRDLIRHDHKSPRECAAPGCLEFAFVRHPVAWWRSLHSYMGYRARKGKRVPNESRDSVWSATFGLLVWSCRWDGTLEEFLEDCWRIQPAMYSRVVSWFTPRCVLGRTEHLLPDLAGMLDLAGVAYDREVLMQSPIRNKSPLSEVDPETATRILEQEALAFTVWESAGSRLPPTPFS